MDPVTAGNASWILISGALVLLMTPVLALFMEAWLNAGTCST